MTLLREMRPRAGSGFRPIRDVAPRFRYPALARSAWSDGVLLVFSALENLEAPDGSGDAILQWHLSFSRHGKPTKPHDARRVLRAFGMTEAEEDNHEPGVARHYFLCVDPRRRVECECKTGDRVIVEANGHRWSCPEDPRDCGACNYALMRLELGVEPKPCPLHGVGAQ